MEKHMKPVEITANVVQNISSSSRGNTHLQTNYLSLYSLIEPFKGKKVIHDSDMQKLVYLKSVIKDTRGLHPRTLPSLVPRECRETCKINGYERPNKTKVIVNAWAIGRDPNHWYEAERFIPERFHGDNNCNFDFKGVNFEYIHFGARGRICPGILFGLAGIELPVASLLYHFDWKLPHEMKPEDLEMTETFGIVARRKNKLCLIPQNAFTVDSLHDNSY